MRFQVPQFIEVEDKIFGPLTLKQFIYIAGAAGISVILYISLPLFLVIVIAAPIIAFAALLAFYKINGRPFIEILENGFYYFIKNKLYTWEKPDREVKGEKISDGAEESAEKIMSPKLTQGKLKDLAWSLDVQESIYPNKN